MRAPRPWLWLAVLGSFAHAGLARAAQPGTLRVVVRVTGEADRRILSRVRGQLSDVPVSLETETGAGLETGFTAQLQRASELAADDHTVVVWFRFERTGKQRQQVLVHIAMPHLERVFTRRLDATTAGTNLDSGLLESTALVVRGAIKALAEGGRIGVTRDQAVERAQRASDAGASLATPAPSTATPSPTDPPSPSEASAPPPQPEDEPSAEAEAQPVEPPPTEDTDEATEEPEPAAEPSALAERERPRDTSPAQSPSFRSHLGWQVALDGESQGGHHGLRLELGARWHGWLLAASGTAAAAATIDNRWARLRVARHTAGALVGWQPSSRGPLRWMVALRAEVIFFHRRTEAKVDALDPAPPATKASFAFGPEARLMWMPSWIGIGLTVGFDVLPRPPRFEVSTDGGSAQDVSLWKLQPRAGLGLEVQLS